jgi:hypothetical protein
MARSILSFGRRRSDSTSLLQSAVDSGQQIYFPQGVWVIDGPVLVDTSLNFIGDGPGSIIRGSSNLGERPMFSKRNQWFKLTGDSSAPYQWVNPGAQPGTGFGCYFEALTLESQSVGNSCFQLFNGSLGTYLRNVTVRFAGRGIDLIGAFGGEVTGCKFESVVNKDWLANSFARLHSWAIVISGHMLIRRNEFLRCPVGVHTLDTGTKISGGVFSECMLGIRMGGPHPHTDLLNAITHPSVAEYSGILFKDCLRGIEFRGGSTVDIRACGIESSGNAPQLNGGRGQSEYGIKFVTQVQPNSRVQLLSVNGSFTDSSVVGSTANTSIKTNLTVAI